MTKDKLKDNKKVEEEVVDSLPPMGFEIIKREFMRDKLALFSLVVLLGIFVFLYIAPLFMDLTSATKVSIFDRFTAPGVTTKDGVSYLLGTDEGGRDVLAQLIIGGRNSVTIAVCVTFLTEVIGIALGLIAGYYGGKVDNFMMRIVDFISILPRLVMIIALVTIVRRFDVTSLVLIMSALGWPGTTRLFRTRLLSEASKDYVSASKTMGTYDWKIMLFELLPNVSSLIITDLTLSLAGNIGLETGLSFLGFGLPSGTPSLGTLVGYAKTADIIENKQWVWLPAAIFILVMMLCINYVGQALQRSADSKQRIG